MATMITINAVLWRKRRKTNSEQPFGVLPPIGALVALSSA
jgi:hypothetical protein